MRDANRIALPPMTYAHEKEKIEGRWPAAVRFIAEHKLNEVFEGDVRRHRHRHAGRDVQHRDPRSRAARARRFVRQHPRAALRPQCHLPADRCRADPLLRRRSAPSSSSRRASPSSSSRASPRSCAGPTSRPGSKARACCRWPASTPAASCATASGASSRRYRPDLVEGGAAAENELDKARLAKAAGAVAPHVHTRPPSFCTGCPERPIFAAMKLVERELGAHHVSCDIGCHLFSILPPFNIGNTTMGYGLGGAGAAALNAKADKRAIAVIGDGGFWHNGLVSSIGNAVFNRSDNVHIIVDNGYSAATGGQDLLSSRGAQRHPLDQELDREGGARRRRPLGAHAAQHLRRRQDARHAEGGADHGDERSEGHRRPVRMHAEPSAPRAPADGARR